MSSGVTGTCNHEFSAARVAYSRPARDQAGQHSDTDSGGSHIAAAEEQVVFHLDQARLQRTTLHPRARTLLNEFTRLYIQTGRQNRDQGEGHRRSWGGEGEVDLDLI